MIIIDERTAALIKNGCLRQFHDEHGHVALRCKGCERVCYEVTDHDRGCSVLARLEAA